MVTLDHETHMVLYGRSSAGKGWWWRKNVWKVSKKPVVYFNTQWEKGFGREIFHWDPKLLQKPRARVNFCPPMLSTANGREATRVTTEALARIVDDMFRIGEQATRGQGDERTPKLAILCMDEAQIFAYKGKGGPGARVATNGNRFGIAGHYITQRPAILDHTCLTQAPVHVAFDLDDMEAPYLRTHGVPENVQQWISSTKPGDKPGTPSRRYAVRQGKIWTLCNPIGA